MDFGVYGFFGSPGIDFNEHADVQVGESNRLF